MKIWFDFRVALSIINSIRFDISWARIGLDRLGSWVKSSNKLTPDGWETANGSVCVCIL